LLVSLAHAEDAEEHVPVNTFSLTPGSPLIAGHWDS
jgi:hypothetical protein